MADSIRHFPLAIRLAVDDIEGKYRRTALGPVWIILGQVGLIAGFLMIFTVLFGIDRSSYAIYLAAGFPVWALISSYLTEMPNAFVQSRGYIESFELPWLLQVWRRSIGYLLIFAHQIVTLFVVMAFLQTPPSWEMLLAIPALLIVSVGGVGIGIVMGVLGARYRDLHPTMGILTRFLFFFSAVMWRPEQLTQNRWLVDYNPLHHVMQLVRDPLMGVAPQPILWICTSLGAVLLLLIGFVTFWVSRRRLYHWL
jgi:ABC-type polysaccharide/polyol phosphate export permease